ncbi:MAG: SRPBCC domain-containing protein [Myxococcales bacterium]|nr:SRPBCC domain-containing protein [Myxococcales bacterium]MCB9706529.1 SRPBCC domain-containing protein [Myxococcales bacterium]
MATHEVVTEITIAAPPERVWQVLVDTAAYPQWNPLVRRLRHRGPLIAGARGLLSIELLPGRPPLLVPVRLRCVDRQRELSWTGGIPGVVVGLHYHRIVDGDARSTRLVHGERFEGALVPLLRPIRGQLQEGYARFNAALKARAEGCEGRSPA